MADSSFAANDAWLASMLPFVRSQLPPPPARVVEIGCGSVGGFVPALTEAGYDAVGVDPEAPAGTQFRRMPFEQYAAEAFDATASADVVIASLSLHHVVDPAVVLDAVAGLLAPGGQVVVLEWASERFDEATARWCFARLGAPRGSADKHHHDHDRGDADAGQDDHDGHCWLHQLAAQWQASGRPWELYLGEWLREHDLHSGEAIIGALQQRFDTILLRDGPYYFTDLEATREDEVTAIEAGEVQPACLQFTGRQR